MWDLYLDESGDLGFDFVNKKPSKYFVVTILAIESGEANRRLLNGVKKTLARKLNPRKKRERIVQELKGSQTTIEVKKYFYEQVRGIDFKIYAIALNKKRVYEYLTKNKPRVYNFVSRLLLDNIPVDAATTRVNFVIDKSKSKPEIIDFNKYIRTALESKIKPSVPLYINHLNSCDNRGLQAVDMFSHGIFEANERRRFKWYSVFQEKIAFCTVYLP